jgi:hypothetical protein
MRRRKLSWVAAMIVSTLLTASAWIADAWAAPQQLDCVLTDTEAQPGSESRPIVVVFDEVTKTLTAEEGGRHYSFTKATITYISISGQADDISLGIDRSSLGIVWQQYGADKVATEFGHCHPARTPD